MGRRGRNIAFLGRDVELDAFEGAVENARDGAPTVILVSGDAGIGKTTLLQQAADRCGVQLLVGRCPHGGGGIPVASVVDLVRRARRLTSHAPQLDALSRLLGSARDASAATSSTALFEATLDLVAALGSNGPIIVGIEDLHWADALTWDVVEFLVRNLLDEHVVLVATYRDHDMNRADLRARLAELTRLPTVQRLHLQGLDRSDVVRQVHALGAGALGPDALDDIIARGEGNPLFTEELVAGSAAGELVPSLLVDLFAADLEQLDDATRDVAAVIAIVGRDTPYDLLTQVLDGEESRIEHALRVAIGAALIEVDSAGDAYRFRHPLIAEVVSASLLAPQRRRIHRRIAEALAADSRLALSASGRAGELAYHLHSAGDTHGAFRASLEAADVLGPVAQAAALEHLERALALWDQAGEGDDDELNRRRWQAAELAYATGDGARAVELAEVALTAASAPRGSAWGHERLARYLWTAGRLRESALEYGRAATLLDPAEQGLDTAAVYAGLAQAELLFCHFDLAEHWSRAALEVVHQRSVQPELWLHATRVLGVVVSHRGHHDEAVALCRAAVDAAGSADNHALTTIYLADVLLRATRYEEAVAVALDGAAAGQRAGFERSMGGYLSAMAVEALTHLGRWDEANTVLTRLEGLEAVPVTTVRLGLAKAALAARRGEIDTAQVLVSDAAALPVDPWHQPYVEAAQADVALLAGDAAAATTLADAGFHADYAQDTRWPARFALQYVVGSVEQALLARAKRQVLDEPTLIAELRTRIEAARTMCTPDPPAPFPHDAAGHLQHAEAVLTALSGPDPDAWARATEGWRTIGDPWAVALAQLREAEAAVATGDASRAADRLRNAHAAARAMGARPLLADIDATARRCRIRVDAPVPPDLERSDAVRLGLTSRETEVLLLVAAGHTNRQIGEALFVSEKTASVHVSNILRKLGVTSRIEAAAVAQRVGLISAET